MGHRFPQIYTDLSSKVVEYDPFDPSFRATMKHTSTLTVSPHSILIHLFQKAITTPVIKPTEDCHTLLSQACVFPILKISVRPVGYSHIQRGSSVSWSKRRFLYDQRHYRTSILPMKSGGSSPDQSEQKVYSDTAPASAYTRRKGRDEGSAHFPLRKLFIALRLNGQQFFNLLFFLSLGTLSVDRSVELSKPVPNCSAAESQERKLSCLENETPEECG